MGRRGCRDCIRCIEPAIVTLVMALPRLAVHLATFWNLKLFQRRCPECGHRMSIHRKVRGRLVD